MAPHRPPETTPGCCQIWGHKRWCSSCEGTPVLLRFDRLLYKLACDQGACTRLLPGENIDTSFRTNFRREMNGCRNLDGPLRFSSSTVFRLPRGANCRAKHSGWMLMPTRGTMQGCCRECNMLASWRNSEKLRQASADCRCFTMVSEARKDGTRGRPEFAKGKLWNYMTWRVI